MPIHLQLIAEEGGQYLILEAMKEKKKKKSLSKTNFAMQVGYYTLIRCVYDVDVGTMYAIELLCS